VQQKEELLKQSKTKQTTADSVKSHIDTFMKTALDIQKKVDDLVGPMTAPLITVDPPAAS